MTNKPDRYPGWPVLSLAVDEGTIHEREIHDEIAKWTKLPEFEVADMLDDIARFGGVDEPPREVVIGTLVEEAFDDTIHEKGSRKLLALLYHWN